MNQDSNELLENVIPEWNDEEVKALVAIGNNLSEVNGSLSQGRVLIDVDIGDDYAEYKVWSSLPTQFCDYSHIVWLEKTSINAFVIRVNAGADLSILDFRELLDLAIGHLWSAI